MHRKWCVASSRAPPRPALTAAVPHGGVVTANLLAVAKLHFDTTLRAQKQPHTLALHADFLRRTEVGPCRFRVTDTKLGRQTSVIHVSLSQGREEVVAYITRANLGAEEGPSLDTEYALHPPPPSVDLARLAAGTDAQWERQGEMPYAAFRKATTKVDYNFPRAPGHMSIGDEWIRLVSGEGFTNEALGFAADIFALPAERMRDEQARRAGEDGSKGIYWYPTVLLNLEFKKLLPPEGVQWLFSRCQTKRVQNGRMDIEIVLADAEGDIVALSHHICMIVPAARNIAPRRGDKESKM